MKKYILFLIVLSGSLLSQNKEAKKWLDLANSDYKNGLYSQARLEYQNANFYDTNNSFGKKMLDSCNYYGDYLPALKRANKLLIEGKVDLAQKQYYNASRYINRPNDASLKLDSLNSDKLKKISDIESTKRKQRILKFFKDSNAKPLFDDTGLMYGYVKADGEQLLFSDYDKSVGSNYKNTFQPLKKADWDMYQAGAIQVE